MLDKSGQLALMDAVVFFLVATTISGVVLYYSSLDTPSTPQDHGQGQADPHEILETLLRSFIGTDIIVHLDIPRHISWDTDIGQCLLLEAEAILDGMMVEPFRSLNEAIRDAIYSICSPMYTPFLAVLSSEDAGSEPLISIPGPAEESSQRFASVMQLSHDEEKNLLVQLLLCPSALAEVVRTVMSDLHLCASVLAPPAEFQP